MIFFLLRNTKGEFLNTILAVVFTVMKVNGERDCQCYKWQKYHIKAPQSKQVKGFFFFFSEVKIPFIVFLGELIFNYYL